MRKYQIWNISVCCCTTVYSLTIVIVISTLPILNKNKQKLHECSKYNGEWLFFVSTAILIITTCISITTNNLSFFVYQQEVDCIIRTRPPTILELCFVDHMCWPNSLRTERDAPLMHNARLPFWESISLCTFGSQNGG